MAFDGIVLSHISQELNSCLIGGKVNKVFEPNNNEIILGIYSGGKNYALLCNISSSYYRIHLTTTSKPNPLNAPNFCMLLRKHLVGYKVKNISTFGLERIVTIDFEGYNELNDLQEKKIILEIMGKHSNIILLNNKNIIIDSIKHFDVSSGSLRDIMPAREYIFPSSNKKDFYKTSKSQFIEGISGSIIKSVSSEYTGISSHFVASLINYLEVSDDSYSESNLEVVYDSLNDILNNLGTNKISINTTGEKDYSILPINTTETLQANFFLDDFYSKKEQNDSILIYKNNLLKLVLAALKRVSKKIANINDKLEDCKDMDKYRMYGELITSNLYQIDDSSRNSLIVLDNYYDNNNKIEIPLDNTISASFNAKKFFKKYHKLKNTLDVVSSQKIEAEKEIGYLESVVYELENASSIDELDDIEQEILENGLFKGKEKSNTKKNKITNKKKINNEFTPITYTVDGFTLYVGKNNKQNDYITTKLGKNEDLWFHTKNIRGSHCLLKCNGSHLEEKTVLTCAQIAAFYSKGKLSSNVPVDYCFARNVKKPSGSKPGMVIYTNQKTLFVNPKSDF